MAFLSTTLSLGIAALSVHCLYYSAQSIPKLQKYEDRTKKAARWSNAAEKRLWDTRYTVGAGFAMTLVSLLSGCYYTLFANGGFSVLGFMWAVCLCVAELTVWKYMKSFWAGVRKVPLMDDYNDAISDTLTVMDVSVLITWGWGILAGLKMLGY